MKKLISLALLALTPAVFAETLIHDGELASACGFSDTFPGSLTVSGTSVTTASNAGTSVSNNDPGVYELTVGTPVLNTPSTFQAANGTTTASSVNIIMDANGANGGIFAANDDTNGSGALAADGFDDLLASVSYTLSRAATAGSYQSTVEVNCVAGGEGF